MIMNKEAHQENAMYNCTLYRKTHDSDSIPDICQLDKIDKKCVDLQQNNQSWRKWAKNRVLYAKQNTTLKQVHHRQCCVAD